MEGVSYTSQLYLGNTLQKSELVYDTGSGWLIVTAKGCGNCESKAYDPSKSDTSKLLDRKPENLRVNK